MEEDTIGTNCRLSMLYLSDSLDLIKEMKKNTINPTINALENNLLFIYDLINQIEKEREEIRQAWKLRQKMKKKKQK